MTLDETGFVLSVQCPNGDYQSQHSGEHQTHDINWQLGVRIQGHKQFEDMTADEITRAVSRGVSDKANDVLWGMTKDSYATPPDDKITVPQVHVDAKIDSSMRDTEHENRRYPFLQDITLSGTASVDADVPITEDQAWLLAKKNLSKAIAEQALQQVLEKTDYKGKSASE